MSAQFLDQPADWSRSDWLAWRAQGVGASDVASICGLSSFGSPTSVYYEKTLHAEQPESEQMRWGTLLEPVIGDEFTTRTGLHVVCPQLLVWDGDQPWRRATLDGLVSDRAGFPRNWIPVIDALGLIEKKTTRDGPWDPIPDRVQLQVQWQLGVAQMEHAWLAVLHGGQRLEIHEVDADPAVFERLCGICDRFWEEHVQAENPPPADSNPATTAALKSVFGERATDDVAEFDAVAAGAALSWLGAKEAVKAAQIICDGYENCLRAALAEASFGVWDGAELVSWKAQQKARHVDWKALRADHPDLYEKYSSPPGLTRVLRPSKALRALAEETS